MKDVPPGYRMEDLNKFITLSNENEIYYKRNYKSPYIKYIGQYKQEYTAEFKRVAEFKIRLCKVCHSY